MKFRIVTDSSCNVLALADENYASVPLKIMAGKEYVDAPGLDVAGMVADLRQYKGKSGSSCPNVGEWLDAFADATHIFAITITKHLSGSYNAAFQAAECYMQEYPERKVFVIDSLATGPEMMLIHDKVRECEAAGMDFDATREAVLDYANDCHTVFCLESMMNLARNGRTSMAVAKLAGLLGIRVAGEAQKGQLDPVCKPRGAKNTTLALVKMLTERGFADGNRLRIAHCNALENAVALQDAMLAQFPNARVQIEPTTALCSFYAEEGGLIIGFEGSYNAGNDKRKF